MRWNEMYYSKQTDKHGNTLSVQMFKTRRARDIACDAFCFEAIKATEARPYIARDATADRNHVSYCDRDTNVMDMHSVLEYWEDAAAFEAAAGAGEFD